MTGLSELALSDPRVGDAMLAQLMGSSDGVTLVVKDGRQMFEKAVASIRAADRKARCNSPADIARIAEEVIAELNEKEGVMFFEDRPLDLVPVKTPLTRKIAHFVVGSDCSLSNLDRIRGDVRDLIEEGVKSASLLLKKLLPLIQIRNRHSHFFDYHRFYVASIMYEMGKTRVDREEHQIKTWAILRVINRIRTRALPEQIKLMTRVMGDEEKGMRLISKRASMGGAVEESGEASPVRSRDRKERMRARVASSREVKKSQLALIYRDAIDYGIGQTKESERYRRALESIRVLCRVDDKDLSSKLLEKIACFLGLSRMLTDLEFSCRYHAVKTDDVQEGVAELSGICEMLKSHYAPLNSLREMEHDCAPFILLHAPGMCRRPLSSINMSTRNRCLPSVARFKGLSKEYNPLHRMLSAMRSGPILAPMLTQGMYELISDMHAFVLMPRSSQPLASASAWKLLRSVSTLLERALCNDALRCKKGMPPHRNFVLMVKEWGLERAKKSFFHPENHSETQGKLYRGVFQWLDAIHVLEGFTLHEMQKKDELGILSMLIAYNGNSVDRKKIQTICERALYLVDAFCKLNLPSFSLDAIFGEGEGEIESKPLFLKPMGAREDIEATHDSLLSALCQLKSEVHSEKLTILFDQIAFMMHAMNDLMPQIATGEDLTAFASHISLFYRLCANIDQTMHRITCHFIYKETPPAVTPIGVLEVLSTRFVSDSERRARLNRNVSFGSDQYDDIELKRRECLEVANQDRLNASALAKGDTIIDQSKIRKNVRQYAEDVYHEMRELIETIRIYLHRR